jgi:hydroxymethylpyrimidine kinase/phosphomethylpyrimidine kinase
MNEPAKGEPVVLAIAGFDPSGGAGIILDIKATQARGCKPVAAITSITFQNSEAFFGAIHQTAESIRSQVLAISGEFKVAAVKIGMLPTVEIVREVARLVRDTNLPAPVVDPVLRSTSGHSLIEEDAISALIAELLPLARVITPNIPEAEQLTGLTITSEDGMREAAQRLRQIGARAVLVKGGHLPNHGSDAIDVLDDEGEVSVLRNDWIEGRTIRGTGCMLSSAIAAGLAHKKGLAESVHDAKMFVAEAIHQAQF